MLFYHLGMLNHYLFLAYIPRVKMRKNETGMAVEHGIRLHKQSNTSHGDGKQNHIFYQDFLMIINSKHL